MKSLLEFMNRDRLKKYKVKPEYRYFPKDREELINIIRQLIKERGWKADLNDIDTSGVEDMHDLFCTAFIPNIQFFNGDISQWDVSKVTNMEGMFYYSDFNGDISDWEPNPDCDMTDMFENCPLENHPPKWYKK